MTGHEPDDTPGHAAVGERAVTVAQTVGWLLAGFVVFVLVVGFLFRRQEAQADEQAQTIYELHTLVRDEEREERLEEARDCVDQHDRYEVVRRVIGDATVAGGRAGVHAVAVVAGATREQVELAEAVVEEDAAQAVEPIVAEYTPPECDLDHAQRVVADNQEQP